MWNCEVVLTKVYLNKQILPRNLVVKIVKIIAICSVFVFTWQNFPLAAMCHLMTMLDSLDVCHFSPSLLFQACVLYTLPDVWQGFE